MKVSSFKRCGCEDESGRQLGARCPRLRRRNRSYSPVHGTWYGKSELAPTPAGKRQYLVMGGFETESGMEAWFAAALQLIGIPDSGPAGHGDRTQIIAMIKNCRGRGEDLPGYDEVRRQYQAGAAYESGTAGEYLLAWLAAREKAEDISRNTLRGYRHHITVHALPAFGDIPLARLRARHVRRVFERIDEDNAALLAARSSGDPAVRLTAAGRRAIGDATKTRIRATFSSALGDAVGDGDGVLVFNPAAAPYVRLASGKTARALTWTAEREADWRRRHASAAAEAGQLTRRGQFELWRRLDMRPSPVMVWTPEHAGAFFDHIAAERLYSLFHVIGHRGLRRGEACGLPWAETSLTRARLSISPGNNIVQAGWEALEEDPKSEASAAVVPLDRASVTALASWKAAQDAEQQEHGGGWAGSGKVWTHPDGSALHPAQITSLFERLAYAAGLPPIRLHDLRHLAASLAHAAGASTREIQQLMRHSSHQVTMDLYTSVFEDAEADLAERIAAVVPRRRLRAV